MRRLAIALAALALIGSPAVAAPACVTDSEAQSLALVALPEIIRQTGTVCTAVLPPNSLVRRADGAFLAKYDAAADAAWPRARVTITRLTDATAEALLQSDYARPLLTSLIVPLIVGRIAVADCPVIDRLVTQLAPLPPGNIASVVVTTLQYLKAQKARGKATEVPDLPLCPLPSTASNR